jgi:hypothetical protein
MKLLSSLFWLESKRLRLQIILTVITLLLYAFMLGFSLKDLSIFDIQYSINMQSDQTLPSLTSGLSQEKILSLFAILIPAFLAFSFVTFNSLRAPFRSPSEWQDGQFQLFKLSSWSSYQIQLGRFLVFCLLGLVPIILITFGVVAAITSKPDFESINLARDIYWISFFVSLSILPLFISAGLLVDSLRTAYYLRGSHAVVTFIQYAGWVASVGIALKISSSSSIGILPSITLDLLNPMAGNSQQSIQLYLEPMLVSLVIAFVFVLVSARIIEEAES